MPESVSCLGPPLPARRCHQWTCQHRAGAKKEPAEDSSPAGSPVIGLQKRWLSYGPRQPCGQTRAAARRLLVRRATSGCHYSYDHLLSNMTIPLAGQSSLAAVRVDRFRQSHVRPGTEINSRREPRRVKGERGGGEAGGCRQEEEERDLCNEAGLAGIGVCKRISSGISDLPSTDSGLPPHTTRQIKHFRYSPSRQVTLRGWSAPAPRISST